MVVFEDQQNLYLVFQSMRQSLTKRHSRYQARSDLRLGTIGIVSHPMNSSAQLKPSVVPICQEIGSRRRLDQWVTEIRNKYNALPHLKLHFGFLCQRLGKRVFGDLLRSALFLAHGLVRYINTLKEPNFPSYNLNWNRFQTTKLPTEGKFCNCVVLPDINHLHCSVSNGGDALAFYSLAKAVRGYCSDYWSDGKPGKVDTERTPSERTPFPMD